MNRLLNAVEADYCVDTGRVYASGVSNGANMVNYVACRDAARFAAVAPVLGPMFGRGNARIEAFATQAGHAWPLAGRRTQRGHRLAIPLILPLGHSAVTRRARRASLSPRSGGGRRR